MYVWSLYGNFKLVFNNETNNKFAQFLLREAGLMEGKTKIIQLTNWTEYYKTWKTIDESTGEQGTNPTTLANYPQIKQRYITIED